MNNKKIALCIYTGNADYNSHNDINIPAEYKLFEEYNPDIFKALKSVSLKKRLYELENNIEFEVCIAYNPANANISDLDITNIRENTIHYIYGYFDPYRSMVGGNPALFYGKSIEFNRACEFVNNLKNINRYHGIRTPSESFIFHLRSLFIKTECTNYENSRLFIRTAKID